MWLIVPRPGGDDDDRQRELAGQVPHEVGVDERHEPTPDALDHERVRVRALCCVLRVNHCARDRVRIEPRAGALGGEVRRDRRPERTGATSSGDWPVSDANNA